MLCLWHTNFDHYVLGRERHWWIPVLTSKPPNALCELPPRLDRTWYFIAANEKRIAVLWEVAIPSAITSRERKKKGGFNLGRSVSRRQGGPCACQRLGERRVNHGTQTASPGRQLWPFERSANWNTVDVREKVNDFVRRPREDTEHVLFIWQIQTKWRHPPPHSENDQSLPQVRASAQNTSDMMYFTVFCRKAFQDCFLVCLLRPAGAVVGNVTSQEPDGRQWGFFNGVCKCLSFVNFRIVCKALCYLYWKVL